MKDTLDAFSRPLRSLRLSVTDRCNLRCKYCMPEQNYTWLRRKMLLSFEELTRLTRLFTHLGVDRVRITGGEPLLRRDLPLLIEQLRQLPLREIALTTNGVMLARYRDQLFEAGLDRVTVSLDALEPELFQKMAQRDDLDKVLEGLRSVSGRPGTKIDTVVIKGVNEHQIHPLLDFAAELGAEVRFIEYMDVGGATRWSPEQVMSESEILKVVGQAEKLPGRGSAPAQRYRLSDGRIFGVIASVSRPFCGACDRARVTADGQLLTCLYSRRGRDLRKVLRDGSSDDEVLETLQNIWRVRQDRGAELRQSLSRRGPLANVEELQENVHLEMHTRGG